MTSIYLLFFVFIFIDFLGSDIIESKFHFGKIFLSFYFTFSSAAVLENNNALDWDLGSQH